MELEEKHPVVSPGARRQRCSLGGWLLPWQELQGIQGGIGEADEGGTSLGFRMLLVQNYSKMFLPVQLNQSTVFPSDCSCLVFFKRMVRSLYIMICYFSTAGHKQLFKRNLEDDFGGRM